MAGVEVIDLTDLASESSGHDSTSDLDDVEEIVLDEATRRALQNTIQTISERKLRTLLSGIVETMPEVEVALTEALLTRGEDSNDLIPKWATCKSCRQDYDVTGPLDCSLHPGELLAQEDHHFNGASLHEDRVNFSWSCCDQPQDSLGCVLGVHEVGEPFRKRARIEE